MHMKILKSRLYVLVAFALFSLHGWSISLSQESDVEDTNTEQDEIDEELERLKKERALVDEEKAIAEAKKEIAEAERDTAAAGRSQSETDGLEGDVSLETDTTKLGYFAEVLAYRSLADSADAIDEMVRTRTAQLEIDEENIVIAKTLSSIEHSALWKLIDIKLGEFGDHFENLREAYGDQPKHAAQGTISLSSGLDSVSAGLGGLADIAAFFKTNTKLFARDVDLDNQALVAEVAMRLLEEKDNKKFRVFLPELDTEGTGSLFVYLHKLVKERGELTSLLNSLEEKYAKDVTAHKRISTRISGKEKELNSLRGAKPPVPEKISKAEKELEALTKSREPYEENNQRWKDSSSAIKRATNSFDQFYAKITSPPKAGDKSPMEVVAAIDALKTKAGSLFLSIQVVSDGAEVGVTESIWTGGRVNYIGGTVSVYFLTKGQGEVLGAGSAAHHRSGVYGNRRGVRTLKEVAKTNEE